MTAREYLYTIRDLTSEIANKALKSNMLRDMAASVSSPELDVDRVCSTPQECAPLENLIIDAMIIDKEISILRKKLMQQKAEMLQKIMLVDDCVLCEILSMRYVDILSWDVISDRVNLSQSHVYRLHRQALDEFEKIFQQTQKDSA